MLRLPYGKQGEGETSMLVLLPRDATAFKAVDAGLAPGAVAAWSAGMQPRAVHVRLPQFGLDSRFNLVEILKRLGMVDACDDGFNSASDFTGMSAAARVPKPPLHIGAVIHQAKVKVNEKGTEAAAATAVIMAVASSVMVDTPPPPIPFFVDRPFHFFIQHDGSGALLFAGRVTDPTA